MMNTKNKKILTRLSAVLATLLLVVAMAVPCFADEPTVTDDTPAPVQKVLTEYYFVDYAECYSYISMTDVPDMLFPVTDSFIINLQFTSLIVGNDGSIDSVIYSCRTYFLTGLVDVVVVFTENDATIIMDNGVTEPNTEVYTIEELEALVTSNVFWVYQELQIPDTPDTPDTPSTPGTPDEPLVPENGWYSQIKNIIKEAVFGQDAVLNDSQEFTINQISLWLTLIVILLPLIVGAVILVRCFR